MHHEDLLKLEPAINSHQISIKSDVFSKIQRETNNLVERATDLCQQFCAGVLLLILFTLANTAIGLLLLLFIELFYSCKKNELLNCETTEPFIITGLSLVAVWGIVVLILAFPWFAKKFIEYQHRDEIAKHYQEKADV